MLPVVLNSGLNDGNSGKTIQLQRHGPSPIGTETLHLGLRYFYDQKRGEAMVTCQRRNMS